MTRVLVLGYNSVVSKLSFTGAQNVTGHVICYILIYANFTATMTFMVHYVGRETDHLILDTDRPGISC